MVIKMKPLDKDAKGGSNASMSGSENSKDTFMKTAFIRVFAINETGKDKNVIVAYDEEKIKSILEEWAWTAHFQYWFIKHVADEIDAKEHFHIVIKFGVTTRFSTVLSKFPASDINPARNLKRTIQYLVHMNDPSKTQYTWDRIITNCGDLAPYQKLSKTAMGDALQRVYEGIKSGEITETNIHEKVPNEVFAENKSKIKASLEHKNLERYNDVNRNISVIFITGKTGSGKSDLAKAICEAQNLTYCDSSASNDPFQDYRSQDAIILNDTRDDAFKFHDLLKTLDNHNNSSVHSRYNNKMFVGDLIIITSSRPLEKWYLSKTCEGMKELYRRIKQYLRIDKGWVTEMRYNEDRECYEIVHKYPSPVKHTVIERDSNIVNIAGVLGVQPAPVSREDADMLLAELNMRESSPRSVHYKGIPEATNEEKEARKAYEASLPAINQENLNKYRIG